MVSHRSSSASKPIPGRALCPQFLNLEYLADLAHQRPGNEGLGQERGGWVQSGVQGTGHEEGFGFRTLAVQPAVQLAAVEARHFDVGHQQVDRPGVPRSHVQRLDAIGGFEHMISVCLENPPDMGPNLWLIVRNQNRKPAWISGALLGRSRKSCAEGHLDS